MEGKTHSSIELPELEQEILGFCLFRESFSQICEECQWTKDPHVVADAIKNLIHHKLLRAENGDMDLKWMYDGDRMHQSHFRATAKGIDLLASLNHST